MSGCSHVTRLHWRKTVPLTDSSSPLLPPRRLCAFCQFRANLRLELSEEDACAALDAVIEQSVGAFMPGSAAGPSPSRFLPTLPGSLCH